MGADIFFNEQINIGDSLQHLKNTKIKPMLAWYLRVWHWMLKRDTFFRLW